MKRKESLVFRGPAIELGTDAGEKAKLPTELQVFPAGSFETEKGPFTFDARAAELVMTNVAERGVELPFDYNHGMTDGGLFGALDPSLSAKAAGWFRPELRDGALYATTIRWTPAAALAIQNREWRYLSPTFGVDRDADGERLAVPEADGTDQGRQRVAKLLCVALTNTPAMHDLDPITNSADAGAPPPKEPAMKTLLVLLGLASTATEDQAADALRTLANERTELVRLSGKATVAEALGVFMAWKTGHESGAAALAELTALKTKHAEAEIVATVDGAVKDGKALPAQREMLLSMGRQNPETLKAFVATMPKVHKTANAPDNGNGLGTADEITLTSAEKDVCRRTGQDPAKVLESKKKAIAEGRAPVSA